MKLLTINTTERCADADILASVFAHFVSSSAEISEQASAHVCEWGEGHGC